MEQNRRLPEATREFVQKAFAHPKTLRSIEKGREGDPVGLRRWERQKIVLLRYAGEDDITFSELAKYAGVTGERAKQIYKQALTCLWRHAPYEIQKQYPLSYIRHGKRRTKAG